MSEGEADHIGRIGNPLDVLALIFEQADPAGLLALGSRRPMGGGKGESAPHWLHPVPVGELRQLLPGIFDFEPEHTQYASLRATLKRTCLVGHSLADHGAAIRAGEPLYFAVKRDHVYELCAVAVDLDVGREGLPSAEVAYGHVLDRCRTEQLPRPHLAAMSGRGLYLFWLITDHHGVAPVRSDAASLSTFESITRWLCRLLADLAPDVQASVRPEGWLKRPGTIDTKTGREVVYSLLGGDGVIPPRYKLTDLARLLSVELPRPRALPMVQADTTRGEVVAEPGRPERARFTKRRGRGYGQAERIHLDLVAIVNHYGRVREGMRYSFLWLWYCTLRRMGREDMARRDTVNMAKRRCERGREMLPQVGLFTAKLARTASWTREKLADWAAGLRITVDLAESLALREIVPAEVRTLRAQAREAQIWARSDHYAKARERALELLIETHGRAGDGNIARQVAEELGGPWGCSRSLVLGVRRAYNIRPNPPGNKNKRPRT